MKQHRKRVKEAVVRGRDSRSVFFKVRIRGKQRQRCEEREETEFSQSPCRRRDYGLAQRHPDTHPLYIYHYVVTVTELCRWFSYFYIL